ncbi:MAG: WYL domain-containing protein [Cyanobacteria bacterium SIG31]|nr:WYL domain-containing protein [Cyanobacteria bacterium SIG31]
MFKPLKREEISQISLTGVRSIVMLGLLIASPHSLEEIRQALLEINAIEETSSLDILRIDLNTLKAMGCNISRPTAKNNYKYELIEHPFSLKITEEDIKHFKKVYNRIKAEANIKTLIEYDELINKIANHIQDNKIKEMFIGISALKRLNLAFIKELAVDCKNENTLVITYKKPSSAKAYQKEVIAQELVFQNDQVFLHCYDKSVYKPIVLNAKRILNVLSRSFKGCAPNAKTTNIKFMLKNFNIDSLSKEEFIVEQTENGYIVEGHYYNEFLAIQRILSFGPKCTVLKPNDFREKIIEKLKEMRAIYGN